jgi:sugar O-acyltransferase (sialic acid O-acetyltransferase NeuD family)
MKPILILGAGSTAREIAEILVEQARRGAALHVLGFLDDDPLARVLPERGCRVLGPLELVHRFPEASCVLAVTGYGNPGLRRQLSERLNLAPDRYHTLVHSSAEVSSAAFLGPGCVLMQNVVVGRGVRLQGDALVTQGCCIGHDSEVGRFSVFAPGVTVCGRTRIGESVYFGAGSTCAPGVEIGSEALIGIGSVVVEPVPAGCTVFGNPARVIQRGSRKRWSPPARRGESAREREAEIRQIVIELLNPISGEFGVETDRSLIPEWDSLQQLNLAVAVEQRFGIEFTTDDFAMMNSVRSVALLVEHKLAASV